MKLVSNITECYFTQFFRSQKAFICNYREHWFTIRKLGNQWFNLNSLLTGPELVSNTFLSLFITQLETVSTKINKEVKPEVIQFLDLRKLSYAIIESTGSRYENSATNGST